MGLFFKKDKNKTIEIRACVDGTVLPMEQVEDAVFSSKALGDGVGIEPTGNLIVSPCEGEIVHISDTKHAIGLLLSDGSELLIHVGIDTVELGGNGFELLIDLGKKVKMGDRLLIFNPNLIQEAGFKSTVIMAINTDSKINIITEKTTVTTSDTVCLVG